MIDQASTNDGWCFGYGKLKIHYFFKGISLCGKYKFGDNGTSNRPYIHKTELRENDKRACGICKNRLNVYTDLNNLLNRNL